MTTKYKMFQAMLVIGVGVFAGCARDQGKAQEAPHSQVELPADPAYSGEAPIAIASADAVTGGDNGSWITVPVALRFPGVASIVVASSWDARVAEFSELDQAYLADVSDRYFGAVEFQTGAEQRQLVRQGFPMPREWLAARSLSYTELEQLAEQGNVKAKMFYVDRVSQEIGPILARGDGLKPTPEGRALLSRFARARLMADEMLQSTRSPFAAYLAGRISSAGSYGTPPEPFAAAFEVAKDLGHERAAELQRSFFRQHPEMDAYVLMTSYSSLKHALKR